MKHVIIGTAGHIDHGKSALVEALTGTNPDRLEEEKRRGITIDLGFAFLEFEEARFGFVDVPGHERFVKNMLAGVGGIDLVLLVIAADESIKPQTREHFDICRLLEIPRGVVALTKVDLVEPEVRDLVRLEVEEFVRGSFLDGAPIVPVSARTGEGLDALRQALAAAAAQVPAKDPSRHFRLPVDRAFAMKGFGTVVTGTLVSGSVAPEDEVELFPARRRLRVRGVQSGGRSVERAAAGQRTAVNLAGIELAEVARGMSLAAPGLFEPTQRLDARITLLPSARKLKPRARVHFHQGTAETIAEVRLLDAAELAPGGRAFAQLRLKDPVLVLPGDRFILRQFSPVITIGGGVVLDNLAPRHRARDTQAIPLLETFERGRRDEILAALAAAHPIGLGLAQVIARTGWLESEVRDTAAQLAAAGKLAVLSEQPLVVASAAALEEAGQSVRAAVERFHAQNPLAEGLPKEDLRGRAAPGARGELFRAALEQLAAAGEIAVTGDIVKRAGRRITLAPDEARARQQIEAAFAQAALSVPSVREVLAKLPVDAARAQKILQMLVREQVLVKIAEDLVYHRDAIARVRELLAKYKQAKGAALSVPAFKELTGVSRKYAIPLLEYLDRERVTRRAGDARVIL
jgi:selenocysteine-specific elongation factor